MVSPALGLPLAHPSLGPHGSHQCSRLMQITPISWFSKSAETAGKCGKVSGASLPTSVLKSLEQTWKSSSFACPELPVLLMGATHCRPGVGPCVGGGGEAGLTRRREESFVTHCASYKASAVSHLRDHINHIRQLIHFIESFRRRVESYRLSLYFHRIISK